MISNIFRTLSYILLNHNVFLLNIKFHMDLNAGLFRRPTKSWSTHQLNSIYTLASLGFINISSMILTKFKLGELLNSNKHL